LNEGNRHLADVARVANQIGLPLIVLGELYYGFFLGTKKEQNLGELNRFVSLPRVEILHLDQATARVFGEIATQLRLAGRPIQQDDMWIAALCKQHDYTLATADAGFASVTGLEIVSFSGGPSSSDR